MFIFYHQEVREGSPISKIASLKQLPITSLPPGINIRVDNLLRDCHTPDTFCGPAGTCLNFDLLLGTYRGEVGEEGRERYTEVIRRIDSEIEDREVERAMINIDC